MREIDVSRITDVIAEMSVSANQTLERDVKAAIENGLKEETWASARDTLQRICENIEIAGQEQVPLCQDTGMACVFLEVGQDVHFTGGPLNEAIQEGIRRGYQEGYLRKSIVKDPLRRVNTGDNTPAQIYYDLVTGDQVSITFAAKGFGSENMSQIRMFPPSGGEKAVKDFVVQVVRDAGANPCPPIVVGVGIGGSFDRAALLAKQALLLPLDVPHPDPYYADMERELLTRINELGIGPQGFGGKTTALGVKILTAPTHIAGMPAAVNINCHVSRHQTRIL